jgi:hypothetical protein
MYSDAELTLAYKFANARVLDFPYPHFFIEDVFPKAFYEHLQESIPDPSVMIPIEQARAVKGYKERFVLEVSKPEHQNSLPPDKRAFWHEFSEWLCSGRFTGLALQKFRTTIERRFQNGPQPNYYNEALLVEDITKYALGPHTDSPRKVITMLFYLPKDHSQSHIGTSIYLPKDPAFKCPGGPHYGFENFVRLHTMPFLPNSLFVFCKTDNSFHGVEPVTDPDTRRWLLLYDIYARMPQPQAVKPAQAVTAAGTQASGNVSFTF